jgi:hypothetical protein
MKTVPAGKRDLRAPAMACPPKAPSVGGWRALRLCAGRRRLDGGDMSRGGRRADHYEVLGVTRDAPDEVVRAAYRALAAKHHPDRNPADPDAELRLKRINAAYQVLGDPTKRKLYDELTASPEGSARERPPSPPQQAAQPPPPGAPPPNYGYSQGPPYSSAYSSGYPAGHAPPPSQPGRGATPPPNTHNDSGYAPPQPGPTHGYPPGYPPGQPPPWTPPQPRAPSSEPRPSANRVLVLLLGQGPAEWLASRREIEIVLLGVGLASTLLVAFAVGAKSCAGDRTPSSALPVQTVGPPRAAEPATVMPWSSPTAVANGPVATSMPAARPSGACATCSSQEDFDAAGRNHRRCCPGTLGCRVDSECPNGRVCCRIPEGQLCANVRRCATPDRVEAPAMRGASFPCNGTRCAAHQLCCPGGAQQCVSDNGTCGEDSETSVGYQCDSATNEPCGPDEVCRVGKVGRGPLTMTRFCEKKIGSPTPPMPVVRTVPF